MPACSYYWRVQDATLGLVGGVSMVFFYIILGVAPQAWLLYVGEVAVHATTHTQRHSGALQGRYTTVNNFPHDHNSGSYCFSLSSFGVQLPR